MQRTGKCHKQEISFFGCWLPYENGFQFFKVAIEKLIADDIMMTQGQQTQYKGVSHFMSLALGNTE